MSLIEYFKGQVDNDFPKDKLKEKDDAIKRKNIGFDQEEDSTPVVSNEPTPSTNGLPTADNIAPEEKITEQEDIQEEEIISKEGQDRFADFFGPASAKGAQVQQDSDPGTWTPDYTQMGFLEKTEQSILRGFGRHVIGGTGDILQLFNPVFGMDIAEGNALSRYLQEQGEIMAEAHKIFMPEEIREPGWDMKTFMNPDFWSGHIAEYIPQLIEFIFICKGVGSIFKGAAQIGTKRLATTLGKDVV